MRVILHGPQRFETTVEASVARLGADGPVAAVTAGWRERESEIAELDEVLGGRARNLRLYERWRDVAHRDPEYGAAEEARRRRIEEAQVAYVIRVDHAVQALQELRRRGGDEEVLTEARDDGIETLRAIDRQHLARSRALDAAFYDQWRPHDRPVIAGHRDEVAAQMRDSVAVAIAGGHVGELLACLHLFNIAGLLEDRPVVAWSAGAMAVAETVVLFNDHVVGGAGVAVGAEVYRHGLGLARGIVPLPHARRRLRIDDRERMALLARRFAPARVVVLDDGATLDLGDGTHLPTGALVVDGTGRVEVAA